METQTTTVDTVIVRARRVAKELNGWNKTRLAREAGLGVNGLVDLFNPSFNPTADTLRKLEPVLDQIESANQVSTGT